MKRILILHFFILVISCATNSRIEESQSLANQLNNTKYKLALPDDWHPFLDIHGELSYKPKQYSNEYPDVYISIGNIPTTRHQNMPLSKMVDRITTPIDYLENYSIKKTLIQTKFGETYVVDEQFRLNSKNYITRTMYFRHSQEYLSYHYGASARSFNRYIDDYASIFESLEFKE
ncbi:hypothetical protein SAMN04487891_10879 [Flagellimonas taeanensis]|jgi:hypothetical protein|uniref:Uncharacterized protein n=1 Tax=Flagellimonas taeanensis TaxID=1005926 RepID=A0A1M6ZYS9_9FLAO|nr:hypothetical protein [Allomuricauda taeanensis]SFC27514.1 hypothetical protein SAMN04487891_10879 [Allomuricauda taeanensis]SHL35642.1 hypothetical protein SAMN05216293_3290 [Allomuricauda taeanensis]